MGEETKTVLITGVSSGIGRAIAIQLLQDGWRVFGSVRKQDDADLASQTLGEAFTPLIFDVTDTDSIRAAASEISSALNGKTLDGLINNAGVPAAGPMRYVSIEELKRVNDVNVYGVVRTCQAFIPLLGGDSQYQGMPGKIINISSVSGKISVPFMGPYSMSKFAVEAISDALRIELMPHGIDVVVIGPGPVKTPIFAKTEALDFSSYESSEYADALARMRESSASMADHGLEAEEIGKLAARILESRSPRVRYAAVKNKFSRWTLPRLMPRRLLDKALARRMRL